MFLSRIELAAEATDRPSFWRDIAGAGGAHRALWRLFRRSPDQARDFLFRQDDGGSRGADRVRFYVLSKHPPHEDPEGLLRFDAPKPFAPKLRAGDRLRFSLRASPTVKRKSEVGGGKGKRCDLVMDAKARLAPGERPFDPILTAQSEGERWLLRQGAGAGFEIARGPVDLVGDEGLLESVDRSALRVDGYRQHRIQRKGGEPIRFSTVDFEGALIVRDPTLFLERVALGFGPQKAFGCGLMLLRRG